jgi:2-polyprenyl-3-methyl-5-hydroxy-6-metoxy-1,4-benzoquinol methylase
MGVYLNGNSTLRENYERWHSQVRKPPKLRKKVAKITHRFYLNVIKLLGPHRGVLLDISCGGGGMLAVAEEQGIETYGIDISTVAVSRAKQHNSAANLVVADAENLPFRSKCFDFVTCLGSLEHFHNQSNAIHETAMVLRQGGKCVMHVPNLHFLGHIYMAWRYVIEPSEGEQGFSEVFRTIAGWKNLLEGSGLRVIRVKKYNEIWATTKVGVIAILLWNYLLKPLVPTNLSICFTFICEKGDNVL